MLLNRLSLMLLVLALIPGACIPRTLPTPTDVPIESPDSVQPSATIPREPSPTPTSQPSPGESTPIRTPPELPPPGQPYPVESPTGQPGEPAGSAAVSGKICPPGEDSATLTAYFENIETIKLAALPIAKDQSTYSLEVDPGQYIAFAYPNLPDAPGGLYSEAVPCGLTESCTDHNPKVFQVETGRSLDGIDLCDWSAPESVPPNPAPSDPRLSGMVYWLNNANYFRYAEDGQAHPIFFTESHLVLSPDGGMGVFKDFEKNDLFTVEFTTGEISNLTNTPQVYETAYDWEPGLPETIIFTALAPGQGPDASAGGLYAIDADGSNRTILDDEHEAANFAISPDGQMIAYGWGETAFLYNLGSGVSEFNPRRYNAELPDDVRIASPDWSPDGKRIAWHMRGNFGEQHQEGFGIFDLEAKTFQLIHPSAGDGRGPGAPWGGSWSPDGKWLAVPAWDVDPGERGIWLVDATNPDEEVFLGESTVSPVWSPDSRWLAYHDYQYDQGTNQVWLYDPNTGERLKTSLPPQAWAVDW